MRSRKEKRKGQVKKNTRVGNIIRTIIFVIALVVFLVSGYKLFQMWNEYHKNKVSYNKVQKYAPEKKTNKDTGKKEYVFSPEEFKKLKSMNSDFVAWIYIPNTEVNYPVVQTTNNSYYLTHNFEKQENAGGAIFVAVDNKSPFNERNTIIHGHHMRDGSMFASLQKFEDADFLKENSIIYITDQTGVKKYKIFSVYHQKVNDEPYQYGFTNDDQYLNFLNKLKNKSLVNVNISDFTANDQIVTLSTCNYEETDGRLLVHARLIG